MRVRPPHRYAVLRSLSMPFRQHGADHMRKDLVKISKFLSLVLRHKPETIGITLDPEGWIEIDELLDACARSGKQISIEKLLDVVAQNDKMRFLIRDGRIRANQGHSMEVNLGLQSAKPPEFLYHGTAAQNWGAIARQGLKKMNRHHVHLSKDEETAHRVGMRHGKPIVLRVTSKKMYSDGYKFFLSENNVWLTESVPTQFFEIFSGAA